MCATSIVRHSLGQYHDKGFALRIQSTNTTASYTRTLGTENTLESAENVSLWLVSVVQGF